MLSRILGVPASVRVMAMSPSNGRASPMGTSLIETYHSGGLDYLGDTRKKLGLPRAVTDQWEDVRPFRNRETGNFVHPAMIPAHDQLMAYAAQIGSAFTHQFQDSLRVEFGPAAAAALAGASRLALVVWQAYAFLAPGGTPYNPGKPLRDQLGQHFGQRSALGYFAHKAKNPARSPTLDDIITEGGLEHLEWVRSAKTRAAETFFIEQLLKRARVLLPN